MTVRFALVDNSGNYSGISTHGCFGTLMAYPWWTENRPEGGKKIYTGDYDYIHYFQHWYDNFSPLKKEVLEKDTAFKLKIFTEIMDKFPWMKDIITVEYASDENTLKGEDTPQKGTLIAKLNLDSHGDTLWFCLNLFRLITREGNETLNSDWNGGSKPFKSVLEIFYELTEGDAWKTVLLTFGFRCRVNIPMGGDAKYVMDDNGFAATCFLPLSLIPKDKVELFIKDPINLLNKFDNVKKSNAKHGFFGEHKEQYYYFTGSYCGTPEEFKRIYHKSGDRKAFFKKEVVIEQLFGKDMLDKIESIFTINSYGVKNYIDLKKD